MNASYLQAHISRRHGQIASQQSKISPEIELEFEKIKDKLRETENQLAQEKNSRFNSNNTESGLMKKFEEWKEVQKKMHAEDVRMMEEKFLKEIEELRIKNMHSEKALNEFEKKLGKQSNVGTLEDEMDETLAKQQKEYKKLKTKLESSVSRIK